MEDFRLGSVERKRRRRRERLRERGEEGERD